MSSGTMSTWKSKLADHFRCSRLRYLPGSSNRVTPTDKRKLWSPSAVGCDHGSCLQNHFEPRSRSAGSKARWTGRRCSRSPCGHHNSVFERLDDARIDTGTLSEIGGNNERSEAYIAYFRK